MRFDKLFRIRIYHSVQKWCIVDAFLTKYSCLIVICLGRSVPSKFREIRSQPTTPAEAPLILQFQILHIFYRNVIQTSTRIDHREPSGWIK